MDEKTVELVAALVNECNRIANAVEILVAAQVPAPNYKRQLRDFADFDWSAIGAHVLASDSGGPTKLEWNGRVFTRRNSADKKKGQAIWFSAVVAGTVQEGNLKWGRLISFKDSATEPEPLDEKLAPAAAAAPVTSPTPAPAVRSATPAPAVVASQGATPATARVANAAKSGEAAKAAKAKATAAPALDEAEARKLFYSTSAEAIRLKRVTAQQVNDLVRGVNGEGFAGALAKLQALLAPAPAEDPKAELDKAFGPRR